MPPQHRVVPQGAEDLSRGKCCAITCGRDNKPYVLQMPTKVQEIVRQVKVWLSDRRPQFTFTSIQLSVNCRASLHTDSGNMGRSLGATLGPFVGGNLCIYDAEGERFRVAPPHTWTDFDGRHPHLAMPYAGC